MTEAGPPKARQPIADPLLAFLEAMPDGMAVSDTDGQIVMVNLLLEELSGYERAELAGKPIEILVPERYAGAHRGHRGAYYEAGLPPRAMGSGLEIFLRRKDGSEVPVDISLSAIELGGRRLVLSAVRDATERRRNEATIRESERRWRAVLESVRLVVVGLDTKRRITYANPFLRTLCGYSEEQMLGRDWFELCLPEGIAGEVDGVFRELLESESPAHFVNEIRTKTGERRIIAWYNAVLRDLAGEPIGTLSIGEDITDRKRAQDRLEAVGDVSRTILEDRPLHEVLRAIASRARSLVGASVATIATPEPRDETLVLGVADGDHASDLEGMRFAVTASVSGHVMRSREPLILDDASSDTRVYQPVVKAAMIGPALWVPLAVGDHVFGTLLMGRPAGAQPFTPEDLGIVELFASQASIALEHARFQAELHRLVVLEDRERIGRELHDGAIQSLFSTGMRLQSALTVGGEEAKERVGQAVSDIDGVIRELRNYIFGLRPALTDRQSATDTLRRLVEEVGERTGVVTVIDIDDHAAAGIEPAGELVQFVREALSNVARHANATTCRVSVQQVDGRVVIEVDDDGQGFRVQGRMGAGQGLPNLRDRAAAMGAAFEINSAPGNGTVVRAVLTHP